MKTAKPQDKFTFVSQVAKAAGERRKRSERLALILAMSFCVLIALLTWLTDGRLFGGAWDMVMQFEAPGAASRNPAINCLNPRNKNTPYCAERKGQIEGEWQGISRHHKGKSTPFTLHGGK